MNNGIVDSKVHLLRAKNLASEFEILGLSIFAHLSAIPGLFSKKALNGISGPKTIQQFGRLYRHPGKMTGYVQAWIGKAFEYAVAELFNNHSKPYRSLICEGIEDTLSTRISPKVRKVSLDDIERLSCIRVARECTDAEDLIGEFGRFRTLQDARRSIANAAKTFPGLENKVDVIFCEREVEVAYRFAIMASCKVNRKAFLRDNVRRDFHSFPTDLGISVETKKYLGVKFEEDLGVHVVYLPMDVVSEVYAWERATRIVEKALYEGERNRILQYFRSYFPPGTPAGYWVDFLAKRLRVDLSAVVQEIRQTLRRTPGERITTVPVLLGAEEDTVVDLVVQ